MREKYLVFILLMILVTVLIFTASANNLNNGLKKVKDYDNQIKTAQERLNSARIMDEKLSQFSLIIDNSLSKSGKFTFEEINDFKRHIGELAHDRDEDEIGLRFADLVTQHLDEEAFLLLEVLVLRELDLSLSEDLL